MHTSEEKMSLLNIGGGAAIELFDVELQRVLKNVVDPNTEPKKPREITLKVRLDPDEKRFLTNVEISCASKIAAMSTFSTQVIIDREGSRVEAREIVPSQQKLFSDDDNVVSIERGNDK